MSLLKSLALACIAFAPALAVGCGTSSTINQSPTPIKCQVALAAVPSLDPTGGTGVLAVTTQPECAWDASTSATWISSLQPASGQGTAEVSFRVTANEGAGTRDAAIVVNGETARVSQRAPCRYEVTPASQTVGVSGGSGSISIVTANECAWTATADAGWIALGASASGTGSGRVAFTLPPNQGEARSGAIIVGTQRAAIMQSGVSAPPPAPSPAPPVPGCATAITPQSANPPASATSISVQVTTAAGCAWTTSNPVAWITIASGASGTGSGSVSVSIAANTGGSRGGALTIAGQTFTVTQAAATQACSYSVSPASQRVGPNNGSGSFTVSTGSGCRWTASSNASWITVTGGASGEGSGGVTFSVTPNTSGDRRTGTLTIAGRSVTVEQNGRGNDD